MFRSLVKIKLTWVFVIVAALMAGLMAFSYLGAFLSPADNTHNLPLVIVNADEGVTVMGANLNYGKQVVEKLTAPQTTDTYKWTVVESREKALDELSQDKAYAALVIPANYSASLMALSSQTTSQPAQIELLTNPAAGTLAGSQAQTVAQVAVNSISKATSAQLIQKLASADTKIAPQSAPLLSDPVQAKLETGVAVGTHSARGMSPFYFALMVMLSGFVGTNIVGTLIDLYIDQRRRAKVKTTALSIFWTKAILYAVMAILSGIAITAMATGGLGMDTPDWFGLGLFAILGVLAVAEFSLFFQVAFGKLGLLVGLIFFTILGVPSSGGPYPTQMLPGFWQFLHEWLPLRYLTDGTRALLFEGGNFNDGLGISILVLSFYTIAGLGLAGLISYSLQRRTNQKEVSIGLLDRLLEHKVETKTPEAA